MVVALVLLLVAFVAMSLPIVAVGYLAVRGHFDEIPLSRAGAVAMSSFVAAGLGAAWLTLGYFGFALGQVLGNGNAGSLIGSLAGIMGWMVTTIAYGSRVTRALAEIQIQMLDSSGAPLVERRRVWLRILLGAVFLVFAVFVAGAVFSALTRNAP